MSTLRFTIRSRASAALGLGFALAFGVDCATPESDSADVAGTTPERTNDIAAVRARFPDVIRPADVTLTPQADGFSVGLPDRVLGRVVLPKQAPGATHISHASGLRVEVALEGASEVDAEFDDGVVFYAGGAPGGGDLILRPSRTGFEDHVVFWARPAVSELAYTVKLERVRALRLVSGRLEVIDASGTPRVRVEPPYVIDARGERHLAALSVDGCPIDEDPRPPMDRELRELGNESPTCRLRVRWSADLEAPLLVDPEWRFSAALSNARTHHTATSLPQAGDLACILLVGGFDQVGNAVAETEKFCRNVVTGVETVSIGPSLGTARGWHTATLVGGKVLITGGTTSLTSTSGLSSAELYDPATDQLAPLPSMAAGRYGHTATELPSNRVLVAGGDGATPSTAQVFDAAAGTFGATISMNASRRFHTAALFDTDRVLIAGGDSGVFDAVALSSAEQFTPSESFVSIGGNMTANRAYATATTLLPSGDVLIVGGTNLKGFFSPTADRFIWNQATQTGSFFAQPVVLQSGRAGHTATALVGEGKVLIAGGFNATGILAQTEVFDIPSGVSQLGTQMAEPRNFHAAALQLGVDRPIVFGGGRSAAGVAQFPAVVSYEVFVRSNGEACDTDGECASQHCFKKGGPGICCEEACNGACESCRAADTGQTAGECNQVNDFYAVTAVCANEAEFALVCIAGTVSVDNTTVTLCGGYACNDDNTACLTTCTPGAGEGDVGLGCGDDFYCQGTKCLEQKPQGETCATDKECQTGQCADGYCCNTNCGEQCEACDVDGSEGVCVQVPSGPPHGSRPACAGEGTECEGTCGSNPTQCDYEQKSCGAFVCAEGVENGGTCSIETEGECTPSTKSCDAFACDEAGERCFTTCTDTEQCAAGAICRTDGSCAAVSSAECDGAILVEPNGNPVDCSPFICSGAACLTRCVSVDDCVAGKVCDEAGACIDPPPDPEPPADCAARPLSTREAPPAPYGLAALIGLAWVCRRSTRKGVRA